MTAANTDELGALHSLIAKTLAERLKTDEGKVDNGLINQAIRFLKDNKIEAVASYSKDLRELTEVLPFPTDTEDDLANG